MIGLNSQIYLPAVTIYFSENFVKFSRHYIVFPALLAFLGACGGKSGFTLDRSDVSSDLDSCMTLLKKKKHSQAISCLESYKSRHYGEASAAEAELAMAEAYFAKKDYLLAAETYNLFIKSHPSHERVPYAYFRAGVSYLEESPASIDRDQAYVDDAVTALGTVVKYYSSSPYSHEAKVYYDLARNKKARFNYYVGRYYFKSKEYLAAIPRFQTIISEYPQLGLDEKSFYYLIESLKRVDQKDLALKYYEVFQGHFPDSNYVKRIKL